MFDQDTTEETAEENNTVEYITPNELAEEMGVDPKNLRAWLRRQTDNRPGRGNRWALDTETVEWIKENYQQTQNRKTVVFRPRD